MFKLLNDKISAKSYLSTIIEDPSRILKFKGSKRINILLYLSFIKQLRITNESHIKNINANGINNKDINIDMNENINSDMYNTNKDAVDKTNMCSSDNSFSGSCYNFTISDKGYLPSRILKEDSIILNGNIKYLNEKKNSLKNTKNESIPNNKCRINLKSLEKDQLQIYNLINYDRKEWLKLCKKDIFTFLKLEEFLEFDSESILKNSKRLEVLNILGLRKNIKHKS
jgi:hypothetical protein